MANFSNLPDIGPVAVPLPGLIHGNILALKLSEGSNVNSGFWIMLSVERASVRNGDITYFGNSLFFVIGDNVHSWLLLTRQWIGKIETWVQLSKPPDPPYLRKIRMQPVPDANDTPVMEVPGLMMVDAGFDNINRFFLTFRGDWSPLFKQA